MLDSRSDGRSYAHITRTSALILSCLRLNIPRAIPELLNDVVTKYESDFFLERYGRSISHRRLRVYLRYLEHLDTATITDSVITQTFRAPTSDAALAEALAERAQAALATPLGVPPQKVPLELATRARQLLRQAKPATIPRLVDGLVGNEEYLRWDIYVFCDGTTSGIEIRRYPTVWLG